MASNTQQQKRHLGSKELKTEDTKAIHQSPVHPEAPSQRCHVGVYVTYVLPVLGNKIVQRDTHLSQAPGDDQVHILVERTTLINIDHKKYWFTHLSASAGFLDLM